MQPQTQVGIGEKNQFLSTRFLPEFLSSWLVELFEMK